MTLLLQYNPVEEEEAIMEARTKGIELDEYNSDAPWAMAGRVMRTMSSLPPSKRVFPAFNPTIMAWVEDGESTKRAAALLALSFLCEGCVVVFSEHLVALLDLVIRMTHDADLVVVEAAYWALSQLAEYVTPPILSHHDVVMPALAVGLTCTPVALMGAFLATSVLLEVPR